MAEIYGQIGSLSDLLEKFNEAGIDSIKSLPDIITFRKNFQTNIDTIKPKKRKELTEEIDTLKTNRDDLNKEYVDKTKLEEEKSTNILFKLTYYVKYLSSAKRLEFLNQNWYTEKIKPFYELDKHLQEIQKEIEDKETNFDQRVDKSSQPEIEQIKLTNTIIEENKDLLYGIIGEFRAQKVLRKLPDTYVVINDFCRRFTRAIFNRKDNTYIKSIQIDHVVIGPTGLYLIETKNWSKKSVANQDLFSPVKQLLRSSFAVFIILNNSKRYTDFPSFSSSWGEEKISPKNIILMLHNKPHQEFQYVKILELSEINSYITGGQPIFSEDNLDDLVTYFKNKI